MTVPFLKTILFIPILAVTGSVNLRADPGVIPPEMTTLFPIGRVFEGVKIPSYTDDVLKTVLEADSIERVDQTYLDLTNLVVKTFNIEGKLEAVIKMEKARFHLLTRQLVSQTPAKVEHPRFVMTGKEMSFDAIRNVSTMTGNVRVVIPKAGEFTGNFGVKNLGE